MPIPTSRNDLMALGYSYSGDGTCRECGAAIEWWRTPKKKNMPMTVQVENEEFLRIPHWANCPGAAKFRKKVKNG